jgi:hypothetical protein
MDIEQYLKERVNDQLNWHNHSASKARIKYVRIEWILIIFASLTPIFVVLNYNFPKDHWIQWVPLVSSALVAMLTGGMKTFRYDERYKKYRDITERLSKEKFQFLNSAGIYYENEKANAVFIDTVERILTGG